MSRGSGKRLLQGALRVGAPALAALALVIVAFGESADIDHDLQLVLPQQAAPGETIPLRALLYEGLRSIEGPRLSPRDIDVELLTKGGARLSSSRLRRARAGTGDVEGMLKAPQDAQGPLRVRARARIGRNELLVVAPLQLTAAAEGVAAEGRALRELQQFAEGGVQRMPFAPPPPAPLRSRIQGGACVPEQPCTIFVHVGEPAATLEVEPTPSVSPARAQAAPAVETSGIVELQVVTHGPEAEMWLRATRAGRTAGRRVVRLAIAQSSASFAVQPAVFETSKTPLMSLAGEAEGCIVDAFSMTARRTYRWLATGSLADCSQPQAVPSFGLGSGIHRLQARRDPFSADSAAVRVVYGRAPGEPPSAALVALATAAQKIDPSDAFVAHVLAHADAIDAPAFPASFGYLAAVLEDGIVPRPRAATGYAEARAQLSETQARLRWLALLALALGAVGLALAVGQRGLEASARASQILVQAGEDERTAKRAELRAVLATLASVLGLLLVFAVIALYVIARGSFPR